MVAIDTPSDAEQMPAESIQTLGASAIPIQGLRQPESALHLAVETGDISAVQQLLVQVDDKPVDINSNNYRFGWTPLIVAAVRGDLDMAWLLLNEGAEPQKRDSSGWTAAEHAALRGNQNVWKAIQQAIPSHTIPIPTPPETPSASPSLLGVASAAELRRQYGLGHEANTSADRAVVKTVATVGHQYLQGESMILVSLGTMDIRDKEAAVILDHTMVNVDQNSLLLRITARGAAGEAREVELPVADDVSTDPFSFRTTDPANVRLHFDLLQSRSEGGAQLLGRAVALLGKIRPTVGASKVTLQGTHNLPIIAAGSLEVIGQVIFNFSVITPFTHPNMKAVKDRSYWKKSVSTMLIGHRGMGKNQHRLRSLQLGENTIQSFVAAANLGANYVEFDVQLTKDHVPVIYHDFTVSETGIDAPVHTLTLEQFMHISDIQTPRPSRTSSPSRRGTPPDEPGRTNRMRSQSVSLSVSNNDINDQMSERMKYTRAIKDKGFKANSRGSFIQAPFTTLSQMFDALPIDTGFNIEVKYPMLSQCEAEEMDAYAVELNSFVDTILATVFDRAKARPIIFSSFNPDICLLLSFKQPCHPILFLTEAGTNAHMTDVRATSLQEAIKFASRWGLLGLVSAAEPLCLCPRLIKVVKESGLVCITYGVLNNDTEMVRRQVEMGIDGVIVDSVLKIGKGLRQREKEWTRAGEELLASSV